MLTLCATHHTKPFKVPLHWKKPVTDAMDRDLRLRGQTDRGYKKPVTNTDNEIAIPLGMKRIPDTMN